MDLKDTRLARICNAYLHKKNRETALKKREEQINSIIKGIYAGRTPNEVIKMLQEVTEKINDKLDDKLRESLDAVESISRYKKLKK